MVKLNRKIEEEKPNYFLAIMSVSAVLVIILIGVFVIFFLNNKEKLYGTWNLTKIEENGKSKDIKYNYQMTFYKDNTLVVTENKSKGSKNIVTNYKYKVEKKKIIITLDDEEAEDDISGTYTFKTIGKKLKLTKGDTTMQFKENTGY